ncbi:hypothetical protein A3K63_05355 [Candidatus Micrarchaeota archaeon RBG_16_49_10]|nr:MAG: hypothetical protein A3K63_05355 [Candidatus Micrarchaeota archaeon RBG_16_49_10]
MELVKVCPKCFSTNVGLDISLKSYAQGSFFNLHKCGDCGYVGLVFPEVDKEGLKKLRGRKK